MSTPIQTRDARGIANGWLMPLWNVNERPDLQPSQVYLTVVSPGCVKGPHLHKRREQRYYLISGDAEIVTRDETGAYTVTLLWRGDSTVVPAGIPSQIRNRGREEAWIINMPSPAWSRDDQDEWPVEDWAA